MGSNLIAYLTLGLWTPLAALGFWWGARPVVAALVCVLVGTLILPENLEINLPGIPPLSKRAAIFLAPLVGLSLTSPRVLNRLSPTGGWDVAALLLIFAMFLSAFATAFGNEDVIPFAGTLTPWDGVSMTAHNLLIMVLPFVVGSVLFRTSRDLRTLAAFFVGACLIYSILALYEVRMSPQLHHTVYGYQQSPFVHTHRWGGYRPSVFMANGLALGLLMAVGTLAATTLARAGMRLFRVPAVLWAGYLAVVLVLCKSTAAIGYGLLLAPAVAILRPRWLSFVALALAALVISYPLTRTTGLFPVAKLTEIAGRVAPERAGSLEFRFFNEDLLLEHALQRPVFGWGQKERARVWDETGERVTTVDGQWIVVLGRRGLFGWAAQFGLLLLPLFRVHRALPRIPSHRDRTLMAGMAVVVGTYAVDLLPNGLFSNLPLFLAGALHGLAGSLPRARRRVAAKPAAPGPEPPPEPAPHTGGRMAGMR